MTVWPIYTGAGAPHDRIDGLPAPPNWRAFDGGPPLPSPGQADPDTIRRLGPHDGSGGNGRVPDEHEIQMVNAALFLRRPADRSSAARESQRSGAGDVPPSC